MYGLISYFVFMSIVSLIERNWGMFLYSFGAAILNLGVVISGGIK